MAYRMLEAEAAGQQATIYQLRRSLYRQESTMYKSTPGRMKTGHGRDARATFLQRNRPCAVARHGAVTISRA
jgi:hypothetical protein